MIPMHPAPERDLMAHGYDLWCLGHIHAPFERVDGPILAVMPGIPQPRHSGERNGGTVTFVSLGEGTPEFERRAIGHLGFSECALDLSACADQQEVLRSLGRRVDVRASAGTRYGGAPARHFGSPTGQNW